MEGGQNNLGSVNYFWMASLHFSLLGVAYVEADPGFPDAQSFTEKQ